ncbi:glycosyltransferase [Effusibacillus consociatus]|uniref:Glycosyltransferase n=1 Tax=Effusibacillus consociatus TaxID=1117041 RepID=A0ABV9PXW0_9BACL
MATIGMVIPTWGKVCGVADYTKQLIQNTTNKQNKIKVYSEMNEDLPSIIKKDSIDIVHFQYEYSVYDLNTLYRAMVELNRKQVPIITTLHSWCSDLAVYNRQISEMSSLVIVHSKAVERLCISHGYPREKLVVMPIGCRLFPLEEKEKTKMLFNITGYPCIGFFGFPFPHKGILNLINAINELKIYFPDIKGYFFAHYPNSLDENHPYYSFQQELQRQFDKNSHLIWIKEFLPESLIVNLLHTMDVNVLPYEPHNYQGVSSAAKMLLAAKRPVLTTDNLFFSDLKDEVYKISDSKVDTIASSLCQMLLDSTLRERLISKANLYLEKNSWTQIGNCYRELYQKFIEASDGME